MLNTHYLIQLDTMFRNGKLTEGTKEFIESLDVNGIPYTIITEQTARTREEIALILNEAGLENVRTSEIYTSAMAAVDYACAKSSMSAKAYVCGGRGISSLISQVGFEISYLSPSYIFFGLNREYAYADYCEMLDMILDGAVLLNTDSRTSMIAEGRNRIGAGAIAAMLEKASGKEAVSFGRGSELLLRWVLKYIRRNASDVTVIGNDLEKDIRTAWSLGIRTVYVADNETNGESLMSSSVHPDYIIENLAGLAR